MTDEERQRIVREIRERTSEAAAAHSLSDDESERAMVDMALDEAEQAMLQRLSDDDPVGFVAFADRPGWIGKRLDDPPPTS
jgi:hypothetical protein